MRKWLLVSLLYLVFIPATARADVSLLVLEAIGMAGEYTGSGHTAVYLSNICSDGPVRLRMCEPGEQGIVISNYPSFGEGVPNEWMAVPLLPFLYGVEKEEEIPLYANGKTRNFLREQYRRNHLASLIRGGEDGAMPVGQWRAMLTSAFNRDVYSLNIQTTIDEDRQFLNEFNSLPNVNEFNKFNRNCADFARRVINRYFPGAARRNVINDFGITTPKAVARSVTRYAQARPERLLYITKYPQVAGPIWRSFDNRNFTEMAFKSKKYLLPTLFFDPSKVAVFAGIYFLTARYNLDKTYRENATSEVARLKLEKHRLAKARREEGDVGPRLKEIEKQISKERAQVFSDSETWDGYKKAFAPILSNAISQGLFQDNKEVKTFFRDLELQSEPAFDANGGLILKVKYYGTERTLGLNRENILGEGSDRELALKLMLAKIYAVLNASEKNRDSFEEFRSNWKLMRQLLAGEPEFSLPIAARDRGRFVESPPPTTVKRRLEKLVVTITR